VDKEGRFLAEILERTASFVPENALRFALGIGTPEDIVRCAKMGWDMFDCVIPTREGRHGRIFAEISSAGKVKALNINNSKFVRDLSPISKSSKIPALRKHSRAYLHHLFRLGEPLGQRLAALTNLEAYQNLMSGVSSSLPKKR
jgi:queuine tRNA-ribosyltransferase